jgi:pimeloyl-ACP methyl ester carboxylesterase
MEHVEVGALRIAFERRGDGPALLLLHGAVCDSRVWRVQLESFADTFTVVAWDAPGCGGSSDAPEHFRMSDYADCLAGFIEVLDLSHPHVLGHSWGSTLAMQLYLQKPSMVRSLVLVGAYAGWAGSLPPEEVRQRLEFALRIADLGPNAFDPTSMRGLFSDRMPASAATELVQIMSEVRPAGTRAMAYALAEADLREVLSQFDVPTLLVSGDADERAPVNVARELHRGIAGSILRVLPGLGHECYLESADTFDVEVRKFLAQEA